MTLPELSAAVDMLRAKGVSRYRDVPGEGFEVCFFPQSPTVEPEAKAVDPDLCACGHPIFAHEGGLCSDGCDEEKCAAKVK